MRGFCRTIFVILLFSVMSRADGFEFAITKAEVLCDAGPAANRLEVMISKSSNLDVLVRCHGDAKCEANKAKLLPWLQKTLNDPQNYHLMQIGSGSLATVSAVVPPTEPSLELFNTVAFSISNYELSKGYALFAKDNAFKEDDDGSLTPSVIKVDVNSNCAAVPGKLPDAEQPKPVDDETPTFNDYFAKPADGGIPHLGIDFSMQGSKNKQVLFSFGGKFRPYTRSRLGFGGHYELTPFFLETEYRINASAADKKNVLNIGVMDIAWMKVFRDDGDEDSSFFTRHSPALIATVTPKLETEWGFKERNLLVSPRATLAFNIYQSRRSTIRINPFVGFEYGFVWASEVSKPGKSLQRPLFGSGLTAGFFRKNEKPLFVVQIDYIRRLFLKPELSYGPDSSGKLVPDRFSRIPREDAKFRFQINATELFAPFIEYEYGRVPPKYNLIDSSFRTGIAFNVNVVWKSFN